MQQVQYMCSNVVMYCMWHNSTLCYCTRGAVGPPASSYHYVMAADAATQKAVDSVFAGGDIPDLPEAGDDNVVEFDIGNLLVVDPRPVDEKVSRSSVPMMLSHSLRKCRSNAPFVLNWSSLSKPGFQGSTWQVLNGTCAKLGQSDVSQDCRA